MPTGANRNGTAASAHVPSDPFLTRFAPPRGYLLALVAALLVALPGLGFGLFVDDYFHFLAFEGESGFATPLDLFCFAPGDPEAIQEFMDKGPMPWFFNPRFKARFFRPLSSALMAMDYEVFGRTPIAYHAHSILWYLAVVAGAALIYRRTLPGGIGVLALLLFAVDEAHFIPAVWWSNRNALVAVAPALLGLAAHLRWREEGWKPGMPLSLAGYAVGLLGGETALCVMAYAVAYEVLAGPGRFVRRCLALVPCAALGMGYLALYRTLGYGAAGSGIYLDPMAVPWLYLAAAPGRFLSLAAGQFLSVASEAPVIVPSTAPWVQGAGLAALLWLAWALQHVWPHLAPEERRTLRWLLAGAALSMLPLLAAITTVRLLLVPSIGASAAIAVVIRHWWRGRRRARVALPARTLAYVFVMLHLVAAPLLWPLQAFAIRHFVDGSNAVMYAAQAGIEDLTSKRVVVVNAPDPYIGLYPIIVGRHMGLPFPRSWWTLSMAPHDMRLLRTGTNCLEMVLVNGHMMRTVFEQLLRDPEEPLRTGDTVQLDGMTVTVLETDAQGPTRLSFQFDAPLEDPQYVFLAWKDDALKPLVLPAPGNEILLPLHRSLF